MVNLQLIRALAIAAAGLIGHPASAAETQVNCYGPASSVSTGLDGLAARFTIQCSSTNLGAIVYFAYRIAQSPATAQMLQRQFNFFIERQRAYGLSANNIDLILYTDLSNKSGNSWGCGGANCRIIDYLLAFP